MTGGVRIDSTQTFQKSLVTCTASLKKVTILAVFAMTEMDFMSNPTSSFMTSSCAEFRKHLQSAIKNSTMRPSRLRPRWIVNITG